MSILSHLTNDAQPCQRNPQCSQGHDCDCDADRGGMEMLTWLLLGIVFIVPLAVWAAFSLKG